MARSGLDAAGGHYGQTREATASAGVRQACVPSSPTLLRALLPRRSLLAGFCALSNLKRVAACKPIRIPLVPGGLLAREEQGKAHGVLVDLVAAIQRRLRCQVQSDLLLRARLIRSFYETFDVDVLIPGSPASYDGHTAQRCHAACFPKARRLRSWLLCMPWCEMPEWSAPSSATFPPRCSHASRLPCSGLCKSDRWVRLLLPSKLELVVP
jgi:hypothetical protein